MGQGHCGGPPDSQLKGDGRSQSRLMTFKEDNTQMRSVAIAICLLAYTGAAVAVETAKTPKPAKAVKAVKADKAAKVPLQEKLSCRTGPNDEQARLIVEVVKGRPMEFAYYSRLGTRVCSIHGRRGDAYTKWGDEDAGNTAVRLLTGSAHLEYKPGRFRIKFSEVDRMQYCGMDGELNGSIEVAKGKSECALDGVFN